LAAVGLSAAIVQGGLLKIILPRLGEQRSIIFGLALTALSSLLYGLASQGWMIYLILLVGGLGGIAGPAIQGLISRSVSDQEQGAVLGALSGAQT
jgi:MFS transporter, DHA1 family, tetracycline resistance protein